jgi:tellurite resistance protein TehA-like permease
MDPFLAYSSEIQESRQSNFNFKTIFLVLMLISACCLLSSGYNFDFKKLFESGTSMSACAVLTLFTFYVLYEFFKSDTCEDLNKSGYDRLKTSMNRGMNFFGQRGNNMGMMRPMG